MVSQPQAALTAGQSKAASLPLEKNPVFWFYGSASMAYGIKNNAFSYVLLYYAGQVLGLPGTKAAQALGIAMIWDALTDLLLGHWSDKTRSKYGRRHPFMYVALFLLPVTFYAIFNPVIELNESNSFLYLLVLAILIRTGTTLFEVPSTALLPDLEADYHKRSRWLALRHSFGWYGGNGIHTLNFFFWVGAYGFASQTGYSIYGAVGAAVIFLTILVSSLGTQKAAAAIPPPADAFRFRDILHEVGEIFESLRNQNFFVLFMYSLLVGIAAGLGMALYLYNVTFFYGFSGAQIAWTGVGVLLAPPLAYRLIPSLSARFGKRKVAIGGILLNISLYPIPYILVLTGVWPELGSWSSLAIYTVFVVLEVMFVIIGNVMLDSMMADVVEDSEVSTERRSEGLFYAARTFAGKMVSAGGIVFAGYIVSTVGMDSVHSFDQMTWQTRYDLATFFLPLYCGLYLAGLLFVSFYRIQEEDHANNLAELNRRRAQTH